jgi:hypothetical protein
MHQSLLQVDATSAAESMNNNVTMSNNNNKNGIRGDAAPKETEGAQGGMKQVRDMISRFEQSKPSSKQHTSYIPKKKTLNQDTKEEPKLQLHRFRQKSTEQSDSPKKVPAEDSNNMRRIPKYALPNNDSPGRILRSVRQRIQPPSEQQEDSVTKSETRITGDILNTRTCCFISLRIGS